MYSVSVLELKAFLHVVEKALYYISDLIFFLAFKYSSGNF